MTDLSKLRWRRYGAIEIALAPAPDMQHEYDMVEYVRYIEPTSRPAQYPTTFDERVFKHELVSEPHQETGEAWTNVATGETLEGDDVEDVYVPLFQAASQLVWHDFGLFRAADDAMGG